MSSHNNENKPLFGAQLLKLPQIFSERLFTIPDYQRGYAWEVKQVAELLKDIDHLMADESGLSHYTGTLVLSRPDGVGDDEYHVVDGQQRMTTLVIAFRMINQHLLPAEQTKRHSLYIRRGEIGNDRAVLCLNSDTHSFFERVILEDGKTDKEIPTLEAHERLLESRKLIGKWLEDHLKKGLSISNILHTVENKLGFLVYAPKEDAETGIMFEVINNRGKQLSELEKVKNYLIYCCVKLHLKTTRNSVDKDWSDILSSLNAAKKTSPSDEGAFLRYCVAVYFKLNKTDSQYGYDELKKQLVMDTTLNNQKSITAANEKILNFVGFMKAAALWYARLYGQQHRGLDPQIIPILNQLRAQAQQASIMPIFLALVIKLEGKGERLLSLLRLLEILNFRVYMSRNMTSRNDTGQGDLYNYASKYFHDLLLRDIPQDSRKLGKQEILNEEDALEYKLVNFILWLAADERFKNSFVLEKESPDDFYQWTGLRYFLMNYEAKLQPNKTIPIEKILLSRKEGKSSDYLSVEHLWARENRNQEGENNRKEDRFEKRRLGNFVLLELRLNIQGSKDCLEIKVPRYTKAANDEPPTDLAQVRRMVKSFNEVLKKFSGKSKSKNYYLEFYKALNTLQEERYCKFAEDRWSIKPFLGYRQLIKEAKVLSDELES